MTSNTSGATSIHAASQQDLRDNLSSVHRHPLRPLSEPCPRTACRGKGIVIEPGRYPPGLRQCNRVSP